MGIQVAYKEKSSRTLPDGSVVILEYKVYRIVNDRDQSARYTAVLVCEQTELKEYSDLESLNKGKHRVRQLKRQVKRGTHDNTLSRIK